MIKNDARATPFCSGFSALQLCDANHAMDSLSAMVLFKRVYRCAV